MITERLIDHLNWSRENTENDNYFQAIQENGKTIYKSRHEGFVYGSSGLGRSGSIGFGIFTFM